MKNKKLLYILIPATFIIWGSVIYNIISNMQTKDEIVTYKALPMVSGKADSVENAYTLLANYRDPFRTRTAQKKSTQIQSKSTPKQNQRTNRRRQAKRPARIYWPPVAYKGIIMNPERNVVLLDIDNKSYIVNEGDIIEEIMLLKVFSDSVRLEFKSEIKTFGTNKNKLKNTYEKN